MTSTQGVLLSNNYIKFFVTLWGNGRKMHRKLLTQLEEKWLWTRQCIRKD